MGRGLETTVLFADIAGFTRFTELHGDEQAADLAERFRRGVERLLPPRSELLKTMGDGVMVRFDDAGEAMAVAQQIAAGVLGDGDPPVRVGMNSGPVVEREGDIFGATVNIAAHLAERARPGEVLFPLTAVQGAA